MYSAIYECSGVLTKAPNTSGSVQAIYQNSSGEMVGVLAPHCMVCCVGKAPMGPFRLFLIVILVLSDCLRLVLILFIPLRFFRGCSGVMRREKTSSLSNVLTLF